MKYIFIIIACLLIGNCCENEKEMRQIKIQVSWLKADVRCLETDMQAVISKMESN